MPSPSQGPKRRHVVAAGFGNALEWYDFGVYGFFAVIIGQKFFPSDDEFASLLSAFGAFAVGYMARPVGAVIFGYIGDHYGRKPVLLLSVFLMGSATFAIGVLPTFEQVGDLAPVLLVLMRLLQGFAVSGEYSSSTIYLIEQAPSDKRGLTSSWSMFSSFVGILLGSGLAALITSSLSDTQLHDWGWRLPFLLSLVLAVVGLVMRWQVPESPAIADAKSEATGHPFKMIVSEWRSIGAYVAVISMSGVGFYLAYVWAVSDLTQHMHISTMQALDINTVALFSILIFIPIAGALSDRIGRKALAIAASLGTAVLAWPLWWLMHQENFGLILLGQIGFAVLLSLGWAVYALMVTETLTLRARCTVISIGNGIAYGIFGGLTPVVATYLVHRTDDDFAPVYLIIVLAVISFGATLRIPDRTGQALP